MDKLREAAQQALEALEKARGMIGYPANMVLYGEELTLREALAEQQTERTQDAERNVVGLAEQAEQEPMAWIDLTKEELHQIEMTCETSAECYRVIAKALKDRNYAAPVRTKDLTDDEIESVVASLGFAQLSPIEVARAVIAADRRKNK